MGRARFVATELKMMSRALGGKKDLMAGAKAYATQIISSLQVKDLKPAKFEAQEANAAARSERAMAKGNTKEAAFEKRNQFLHNVTALEVRKKQEEVDKALRFLARTEKAASSGKLRAELVNFDSNPADFPL